MKKLTKKEISEVLNINAKTVQLSGTVEERTEQLLNMFEEAEKRIQDENTTRNQEDS